MMTALVPFFDTRELRLGLAWNEAGERIYENKIIAARRCFE